MTRPRIGLLVALATLAAVLLSACTPPATAASAPQTTQRPTPPPTATETQTSIVVPEPTATLRPPWRRSKRLGDDGTASGVATPTLSPSAENAGTAVTSSPTPDLVVEPTPTPTGTSADASPQPTPTPGFPAIEYPTVEPTETPAPPPLPTSTPVPVSTATVVHTATATVSPTVAPIQNATSTPSSAPTPPPMPTAMPTPTPTPYVPPQDDYGDSAMAATLVSVGDLVQGDIEDGDDVDFFLFQTAANVRYSISVALETLFDSQVSLWDAGGELVVYNDDFGSSFASRIDWSAPDAATYFISVENADFVSTGTYTLFVSVMEADEHGDDAVFATSVPVSGGVAGSIDAPDDIDFFAVDVTLGMEYVISVDLVSLEDSYLTVWDTDGVTLLAENDDILGSLASSLLWTAPTSGTYYLAVEGVEALGTYELTIAAVGAVS